MTGAPPDVVAVIRVSGVPDDSLVLLVEPVHGPPCERDVVTEIAGVVRQRGVLPCAADASSVADRHRVPTCLTKLLVLRGPFLSDENVGSDILAREERNRIVPGLVQQDGAFAVSDPLAREFHSQPSAQRLGEQQPVRQRVRSEEVPGRWDLVARRGP